MLIIAAPRDASKFNDLRSIPRWLRALYDFHATYVVRPGAGTLVISNRTGDVELDIGEPKPLRWARLAEAAAFAMTIHADQRRKGSDSPYIGHLLGVASLVLEFGGDEDQAIAALLHDAIEDQGAEQEPVIASWFGPRVAAIVRGCTDADILPKPPWRARKEAYIAHLETAGPDIWLVSCADKLYNARAIVTDLRALGDAMFTRFTGGKEGTLWYYRKLAEVFARVSPGILSAELNEAMAEMERLAG